jgi:heterodisulfide reductase subunit A-like polyferredoxin
MNRKNKKRFYQRRWQISREMAARRGMSTDVAGLMFNINPKGKAWNKYYYSYKSHTTLATLLRSEVFEAKYNPDGKAF